MYVTPPFFCNYGTNIELGENTRDIPAGILAAGNPCRVIRELD